MSIRPVFRVASAGLDPRDVRLIGIVFQHSQYNKYDFRMLDGLDLAGIDILIANPVDPRGLDAIASLPGAARRIPSLSAVPRGAQATARYSVTIDRLTLQLLPTLNRLVEEERLQPALDAAGATDVALSPALPALAGAMAAAAPATPPAMAAIPLLQDAGIAVPETRSPTLSATQPAAVAPASLAEAGSSSACSVRLPAPASLAGASDSELPAAVVAALAPDRGGCGGGDDLPADGPATVAAANAIALAARRAVDLTAAEPRSDPGDFACHGLAQRAPARARLQVLVADPSSAAQQQLARALSRMGLEVHGVSGVQAAMQRMAAQYTDLVITESALADGDGFELIRRLRAQPAYRFTPVLLLRSRLHVMDLTRARLAGEVTVLAKPLTRQALEALVRQVLRKSVVLDDLSDLMSPR